MKQKTLFLILSVLYASSGSAEFRTWEDRNGRQFEAEFVRELFEKLTLRTRDGKEILMKADELSDLDLKYVRVMVPPKIEVDTKRTSKKKFKAFELVPRTHDTFLVSETVTVKKKYRRPFTSRLRLEIFLIAKEREDSRNYILLGYEQTDSLFNEGNYDQFTVKTAPVEVDQFYLDAAQQRKGEDYLGHILRITDMRGNLVEFSTTIAGKWIDNPKLLPNLRELWERGRASKRSRHFDKKTGRKVKVPRVPHFRVKG